MLGLINKRCTLIIDPNGIVRGMCEGVWDAAGHRNFAERWLTRIEHELSLRSQSTSQTSLALPSPTTTAANNEVTRVKQQSGEDGQDRASRHGVAPQTTQRHHGGKPGSGSSLREMFSVEMRPRESQGSDDSNVSATATQAAKPASRRGLRGLLSKKPPPVPPTWENLDDGVQAFGQTDVAADHDRSRSACASPVESPTFPNGATTSNFPLRRSNGSGVDLSSPSQRSTPSGATQMMASRSAESHFGPRAPQQQGQTASPLAEQHSSSPPDSQGFVMVGPADLIGTSPGSSLGLSSSQGGSHLYSGNAIARPTTPTRQAPAPPVQRSSPAMIPGDFNTSRLRGGPAPRTPSRTSSRVGARPTTLQTNGSRPATREHYDSIDAALRSPKFKGLDDHLNGGSNGGRVTPLAPRPPPTNRVAPASSQETSVDSGFVQSHDTSSSSRRGSEDSVSEAQVQAVKRVTINKEPVSPQRLSRNGSISRVPASPRSRILPTTLGDGADTALHGMRTPVTASPRLANPSGQTSTANANRSELAGGDESPETVTPRRIPSDEQLANLSLVETPLSVASSSSSSSSYSESNRSPFPPSERRPSEASMASTSSQDSAGTFG